MGPAGGPLKGSGKDGTVARRRGDALFELADSLPAAGELPSAAHLSLEAVHRRGWGSLYAASRHGRIDGEATRDLLSAHLPDEPGDRPRVFAVDVSVWPRCDAEASPGRGYYHPSRHSAGQPIVAGWAYQLVAGLSFERDSWGCPADVRPVRPEEDANDVAAEQVEALVRRLAEREVAPVFVSDAGYDLVRLQKSLEGHRVQILVRLHSGRAFYAEPENLPEQPVGRPFRYGARDDRGVARGRDRGAAQKPRR